MIFRAVVLAMMPVAAMAQDCGQATTQAEMNQCAADRLTAADAGLNEAWGAAMARMRAVDEGLAEDQRGAATSLREAQRAWITVRDKGCDAAGWTYHGGSIRPLVVLSCKAEATEARTEELRQLAKSPEEQ